LEDTKRTQGILVVIVFIAILLLPMCYAVYKECKLKGTATPEASQKTTPAVEGK
jgi:hypothetical protein